MAKLMGMHDQMLHALWQMGVVPEITRKVIIEIDTEGPIKVYIEQFADESTINVVRKIGEAKSYEIIREVKQNGQD